uniref:Ion channel n=1 Tax=Panagrellus redivivus TaxID=6233 RepID=A0A7E4W745_PANRE
MGSTGAGATFHAYTQLIRTASLRPPTINKSDTSINGSSENIGRVKWDEFPLKGGDADGEADSGEENSDRNKTILQRIVEIIKILAPHVGLNIVLLSYISIGALILIFFEADNELESRKGKLRQILNIYHLIINETVTICANQADDRANLSSVERRLRPLLSILSRTHEYDDRFTRDLQMWSDNEESLTTKWTFASALLYALTVVTSTGFDHVTPATDAGRIFTVFFGLLGIPLMFITAADIGKFLSEIVIVCYGKILNFKAWVASVFDAMKDYLVSDDDVSITSREIREKKKRKKMRSMDVVEADEEDEEAERLQLPVYSYFALIIGYCSIGSIFFNTFEHGPIWSFIYGVFFSFNTITTIGLGNLCVRSKFYLCLSVAYVIIGLAVITASLDLCSSTLKETFHKLHYFGRKFRGARRGIANMSDDIREAMKIIAALKKSRPSKERITLEDLKRFLEVQEHLLRQPYVPYNVHIFKWIEDSMPLQYPQYFDDASISGKSTAKVPQGEPPDDNDPILTF